MYNSFPLKERLCLLLVFDLAQYSRERYMLRVLVAFRWFPFCDFDVVVFFPVCLMYCSGSDEGQKALFCAFTCSTTMYYTFPIRSVYVFCWSSNWPSTVENGHPNEGRFE